MIHSDLTVLILNYDIIWLVANHSIAFEKHFFEVSSFTKYSDFDENSPVAEGSVMIIVASVAVP